MKVNNLAVVIASLSFPLIKEAVKVFSSNIFSCSYTKNIILDAHLQTYSLLMCSSSISYFCVVFLSFIAMFSVSITFLLLEDRRMSSLMLILSFFFLFTDILLFFYGKISYVFLLPFLPFMLSTFMKKIE
jgi:hypothetical protein